MKDGDGQQPCPRLSYAVYSSHLPLSLVLLQVCKLQAAMADGSRGDSKLRQEPSSSVCLTVISLAR